MIGISIKKGIGLGDGLQFSSLPENYYRSTGKQLFDVSQPWFFDHNPYVVRDKASPVEVRIHKIEELWNFSPSQYQWPRPRPKNRPAVYLSNAEIWAKRMGVDVTLNRPRLYRYEAYPYKLRKNVLLHTSGKSHGEMPLHIVEHLKEKYGDTLVHIGTAADLDKNKYGLAQYSTRTPWELAEVVSTARMFIGVDSGPSWVANCYPDVVVKKVRVKPNPPNELLQDWIPLEIDNIHSHWDDRCHQVFNPTEDDVGFTYSYKRL